jgi:hypothetical protein
VAAARRRIKPPPGPAYAPVTAEFRASVHRMVDKVLDEHPGVTSVVLGFARGTEVDAASEPENISVKLGVVDQLFYRFHPERIGD